MLDKTDGEATTVLGNTLDQMQPMPPKGQRDDSDSEDDGGKKGRRKGKGRNGKGNGPRKPKPNEDQNGNVKEARMKVLL